jgi:glutathione synthase/RimK-type ligase-like ATP-grasp enzyme
MAEQVPCTVAECMQSFVEKPEEERPLWTPKLDGRLILKKISEKHGDWIHLVQNRDQWRALVNTVINLCDPQNAGNIVHG